MPKLHAPILDDPYTRRVDRGDYYWYEHVRGHAKRIFITLARPLLAWLRRRKHEV